MTDVQDRTVHIVEGEHAEGLIRWFYGEGGFVYLATRLVRAAKRSVDASCAWFPCLERPCSNLRLDRPLQLSTTCH